MKCEFCNTSFPNETEYCPQCNAKLINENTDTGYPPYQQRSQDSADHQVPLSSQPLNNPASSYQQAPRPNQPLNNSVGSYQQAPQPNQPLNNPAGSYQQAPQPPTANYGQVNTQNNSSGYVFDPQSGQYYITKYLYDTNNTLIRQVTYYNPTTKMYSTVNYPNYPAIPNNQYTNGNKSNTKTVIIIVGCIVGGLVILSILSGIMNAIRAANYLNSYDPYSSDFYDKYDDYDDSYFKDYNNDSFNNKIEIRDEEISDSLIKPIYSSDSVGTSINSITLSPYYTNAVEYQDFLYFVHNENLIIKYDTVSHIEEVLIDVGSDGIINNFNIIPAENKLVFSLSDDYYNLNASYYEVDLVSNEYNFLFTEIDSNIHVYKGVFQLLDSSSQSIITVGKNEDNDYVSKSYSMGLSSDLSTYSSYNYLSDGFIYYLTFDNNDIEAVFKTNLSTHASTLIFQGEKNMYYDDIVIDGNDIYYSRFSQDSDYDTDETVVIVGLSELGKKDSEKILKKSSFSYMDDFVFLKNNKNMYYSSVSDSYVYSIAKTDPNNINEIVKEEIVSDTPSFATNNWMILFSEDSDSCSIVNSETLEEIELDFNIDPTIDFSEQQ